MKVRLGFVSNSSSSSFTCNICRETYSGMDMELSDVDMFECVLGHICCDSHTIGERINFNELSFSGKKKYCLTVTQCDSQKDRINKVKHENELNDLYYDEIKHYEEGYNIPPDNCPCCQLDFTSDDELITYLLHPRKQTRKEVVAEMKERFGTSAKMNKVLSEKE